MNAKQLIVDLVKHENERRLFRYNQTIAHHLACRKNQKKWNKNRAIGSPDVVEAAKELEERALSKLKESEEAYQLAIKTFLGE